MSISIRNLEIDPKYKDGFTVITGGNEGIGFATVKMLREHGLKVLLIDWRTSCAEENFGNDEDIIIKQLDVRDTQSVYNAIDEAEAKWGKLRILINNAGIGESSWILEQKPENVDEIIDVNLKALIHIGRYAGNKMKAEEFGTIINISSGNAFQWLDGAATYTAVKQSLVSYTELLRRELWKFNIRASVIFPGLTDTGIFRVDDKPYSDKAAIVEALRNSTTLQSPVEIARIIEFTLIMPHSTTMRSAFVAPTRSDGNKVI